MKRTQAEYIMEDLLIPTIQTHKGKPTNFILDISPMIPSVIIIILLSPSLKLAVPILLLLVIPMVIFFRVVGLERNRSFESEITSIITDIYTDKSNEVYLDPNLYIVLLDDYIEKLEIDRPINEMIEMLIKVQIVNFTVGIVEEYDNVPKLTRELIEGISNELEDRHLEYFHNESIEEFIKLESVNKEMINGLFSYDGYLLLNNFLNNLRD